MCAVVRKQITVAIVVLVFLHPILASSRSGVNSKSEVSEAQSARADLRLLRQLIDESGENSQQAWKIWQEIRQHYAGRLECLQAAALIKAIRSPLDGLDRNKIPLFDRPPWLPADVVTVLGDQRGRHWKNIVAAAISSDGLFVASAGIGERIVLWDARSLHELATVRKSDGPETWTLAFLPNKQILAAGVEKKIYFWEIGGGVNPEKNIA